MISVFLRDSVVAFLDISASVSLCLCGSYRVYGQTVVAFLGSRLLGLREQAEETGVLFAHVVGDDVDGEELEEGPDGGFGPFVALA